MIAPSGQQIEITLGDHRAVVVGVGAGLRTYEAGGREVLAGYGADEMSPWGRGQVLVPWPNRLQGGSYEFEGRIHQLPLSEAERHNAIHGLVRWAPWSVGEREPHRVVLQYTLLPQPGYPFALGLAIEYRLAADGLEVRTTATNLGPGACPYGAGAHPYLTVGTPTVDAAILRVPARTGLRSDHDGIPIDTVPVDGTEYDFRRPRPIGPTRLDNAFTDLERGTDGRARVELRPPDEESGVALWVDQTYPYLMLFTGDTLGAAARCSLAVEPMTCPPNAFRTGRDLIRLEPGGSFTSTWGIQPL